MWLLLSCYFNNGGFFKINYLIIFCLAYCNIYVAQNIDSLKKVLASAKQDTIKIKTLNILTETAAEEEWPLYNEQMLEFAKEKLKTETKGKPLHVFYMKFLANGINNLGIINQDMGDASKALQYYEEALKIKEEIRDYNGMGHAINNIGLIYNHNGNILKALDYFKRSLQIFERLNDKPAIASSFNNLGSIYERQGYVPLAISYYHKALKIQEQINDKSGIANSLINIGSIYDGQKNSEESLDYYFKALKMKEELGQKHGISVLLNNIGVIYRTRYDYDKALDYFLRSLKIKETLNDKKGIANTANNIGFIYFNINQQKEAKAYFDIALKNNIELNYKDGLAISYKNYGSYYHKEGDNAKALEFGLKSLGLANELASPTHIKEASHLLLIIYKSINKPANALEMMELFITMRDSINNSENKKAFLKQQFQYEYDKKIAADSVKTFEEKKLITIKIAAQESQIKQEKTQRIALYGGLLLMFVFAGFMFNRFKVTQKQKNIIELQKSEVEGQKHLIEEKQKEIVDSITYAKRLQEAILPADIFWKENLMNSFILYKPKDIVAGDFYWMETISLQSKVGSDQAAKLPTADLILFAAADCTGHGVPGALVSVVCSNALNRTILEFGITDPGKILDKTRELVIATFEKSDKDVKDGMDISLCCLNKATNELLWAGANNSLWIIPANANTLNEIKPDKQPIGKYAEARPFTTHKIQLSKNDSVYLFTDGLADQFGGEKGKKFKYKHLKSILLLNVNEEMYQQKEKLDTAFENWKGNLEQVDDVCVIGIKV